VCANIKLVTEATRAFAGLAALILVGHLATTPAAAIDLGGGLGLGGNGGSVGGSLGNGGGASLGGSVGSQTGATSDGGVSLGGGRRSAGNFNLTDRTTGLGLGFGIGLTGTTTPSRSNIAEALRDLSPTEQRRLAKKCITILAAPQRYSSEAVAVCKMAATY
jgi:hypothetical protein